jgi:hypothetical protein
MAESVDEERAVDRLRSAWAKDRANVTRNFDLLQRWARGGVTSEPHPHEASVRR